MADGRLPQSCGCTEVARVGQMILYGESAWTRKLPMESVRLSSTVQTDEWRKEGLVANKTNAKGKSLSM